MTGFTSARDEALVAASIGATTTDATAFVRALDAAGMLATGTRFAAVLIAARNGCDPLHAIGLVAAGHTSVPLAWSDYERRVVEAEADDLTLTAVADDVREAVSTGNNDQPVPRSDDHLS